MEARRTVKSAAPSMELTLSAIAVAAREAKRARKRSRYLSSPYTDDTAVQVDDGGEEEVEEEPEPPPDVCATDALSTLRAAALLTSPDPDAAPALRFLALYRRSRTTVAHPLLLHCAGDAPAAAGGGGVSHKPLLKLNLSTTTAGPAPAPAGAKKKQKQKQDPRQHPPATITKKRASAPDEAAGLERASASQSSDAGNNVNVANHSTPAPPKRRRRRNKKMPMNGTEHFKNPVALVLDFAQGTTPLPSMDDLLSTFRRFGSVIRSETDQRSARVVFATRAEAEAAYSYTCAAETLGTTFGPPFAAPRLQDLPPITFSVSPPVVPKLPLKDVRKNLGNMILSLTGRCSSFKPGGTTGEEKAAAAMCRLAGEMRGLLAKVDRMLQGGAPSSTAHHHH